MQGIQVDMIVRFSSAWSIGWTPREQAAPIGEMAAGLCDCQMPVGNEIFIPPPTGEYYSIFRSPYAFLQQKLSIGTRLFWAPPDLCLPRCVFRDCPCIWSSPSPGTRGLVDTQCICPFRPKESVGRKGQMHCVSTRPPCPGRGPLPDTWAILKHTSG